MIALYNDTYNNARNNACNGAYVRFDFYEDTFDSVYGDLLSLISGNDDAGFNAGLTTEFTAAFKRKNIILLKSLPPCVMDRLNEKAACSGNPGIANMDHVPRYGGFEMDKGTILISSNTYYGEEFRKMNRKLSASPFISLKCRECRHFSNNLCRGLFNKDFRRIKESLENKFSDETYLAIRSDYENGNFAFGSMCKSSCAFCLNRSVPDRIMRFIPSLSIREMQHFLHYSPDLLSIAGTSYHCKLGELLDRADRDEIFSKVLGNFMNSPPNMIVTNGKNIDDGLLSTIERSGMKDRIFISVSVNTTDLSMRRRFNLPDFDCMERLRLLKSKGFNFGASIVPMRSMVTSGDIFRTIDDLLSIDSLMTIRIHPSNPHNLQEQEIQDEFRFDQKKLEQDILSRYGGKNIFFLDESYVDREKIAQTKEKIIVKSRDMRCIVLCPEKTYDIFAGMSSGRIHVQKVMSRNGYKDSSSGILTYDDYLCAIDDADGRLEDSYLIIPRSSFDQDMRDFTMSGIGEFLAEAFSRIGKNSIIVFM